MGLVVGFTTLYCALPLPLWYISGWRFELITNGCFIALWSTFGGGSMYFTSCYDANLWIPSLEYIHTYTWTYVDMCWYSALYGLVEHLPRFSERQQMSKMVIPIRSLSDETSGELHKQNLLLYHRCPWLTRSILRIYFFPFSDTSIYHGMGCKMS